MMKIAYPTSYFVWDLETSGLDHKTDRIIELAAIEYKGGEEVDRFSFLLKHEGLVISEKITEITGITNDDLRIGGIAPIDAYLKLYNSLKTGRPHVTHNGLRFDLPFFLKAIGGTRITVQEYEEFKKTFYANMIDTAVLFKAEKMQMPRRFNETFAEWGTRVMEVRVYGLKYNVKVCCDELGIEAKNQHRAMGDVELTNQIYRKLTDGQ